MPLPSFPNAITLDQIRREVGFKPIGRMTVASDASYSLVSGNTWQVIPQFFSVVGTVGQYLKFGDTRFYPITRVYSVAGYGTTTTYVEFTVADGFTPTGQPLVGDYNTAADSGKLSNYYRGGSWTLPGAWGYPGGVGQAIPASGTLKVGDFAGATQVVPGNRLFSTTGTTNYTLPLEAGSVINILCIGGGGGGGGGSGRTSYAGFFTGGGGGAAGGNSYAQVTVTPGSTLTVTVGGGGIAGITRDGVYSSGTNGSSGGNSYVFNGATLLCHAYSGLGGINSPTGTGGAVQSPGLAGTPLLAPKPGGDAAPGATTGGLGAGGYIINTNIGAQLTGIFPIFSYWGTDDARSYPEGSTSYNIANNYWGAGGTGGSTVQSDVYDPAPMYATRGEAGATAVNSTPNSAGAVFIWWGY